MSLMKPIVAASAFALFAAVNAFSAPLSVECVLRGNCIDTQNVMEHLKNLQKIAEANGGNRAAGNSGYDFSANYVAQQLLQAGFKVELQPFSFMKYSAISSAFAQASPTNVNYEEKKDYELMSYSGSGSVEAGIAPVDLALGAGNASSSGCEASDFADFPKGKIALIQRGACAFGDKAKNAQDAGAAGVIIFNQGNTPDREALFAGTLSEGADLKIPVVAVSYPFAIGLLDIQDAVLLIQAETKVEKKISHNVVAETKTGDANNIIAVGAHLDSVADGPGINDNGSGSASILEIALKMKDVKPTNKVRFIWFSAEELGLIGSTKYVEALTNEEKKQIALMINIDMVGSPNYKIAVYDGDGSKFGQKGPEGSALIEKKFHNFFSTVGLTSVETEMNGRSDYASFAAAGIPVGGLFTGAEGAKTQEEAVLFGGTAGEAYDACYHKACDGIDNISQEALDVNTSAIAFVVLSYADSALEMRKIEKFATMKARRQVIYEKHHSCQGDVHAE